MELPPYDPRYVDAERIKRGEVTREAKGVEALDRYIQASIEYLRRNPEAPPTEFDDYMRKKALEAQRLEEEMAAREKRTGSPFSTMESLRARPQQPKNFLENLFNYLRAGQ